MPKAFLSVMLIAALAIEGSPITLSTPLELSQFQWKNRLLFLFAPNRNHPLFGPLHQSLAAQKTEAAERDLVIFEILESAPSSINTNWLDPQAADSLRKKFVVPRGRFAVILVGKDGGIKLNRQDSTQLAYIFALIDAMPMRQDEMRQKSRIGESGGVK